MGPVRGADDVTDATLAGTLGSGPSEETASRREARAAVAIAGGLYFVGALLCASAALLPARELGRRRDRRRAATRCSPPVCLLLAAIRGWGGLGLACVAELWGVVVIARAVCRQRRAR